RILALFQLTVWLIGIFIEGYLMTLSLDYVKITQEHQYWRLFTFVFIQHWNPIFVIFAILILWLINDALEQAWGSFRLNLYLVATWFGIVAGAMLAPHLAKLIYAEQVTEFATIFGWLGPLMLNSMIFIAFATLYPNHEFMLFFIIPVKVKWLAMINAVIIIAFAIMLLPIGTFFVLMATGPYLVIFLPQFIHYVRHSRKAKARKARFKAGQISEDEAFHKCVECGITEQDDPDMEFRVEDDGEEYCEKCRPVLPKTPIESVISKQ
ncbi:MAG: rhomboid family intramembrane serine protease, partial [Verrucomicrobiota bacterium]